MAVDNRNFVNTLANEGGADVLVEDKRMDELRSATAKTSSQISTSAQYIPLQDTDGNLVKINAASFQEAVRNTLGSLLANNDKGTTISGIPALSGSGGSLDFGSVSPANLASVLGRQSNGVYQAKIVGSSIDKGYAHLVITSNSNSDGFCVEVSESGSKNLTDGRHPTKVLIGYEGATSGIYAHYICGSGKAYYYKETSTKIHFILAPDTNIDYSDGFVLSTRTINTAANVRRSGFDISAYTEMTVYNNSFDVPDFYKDYANLSSLANALKVSKSVGYISSYASSNDADYFCGETLFGMTDPNSNNIPVSTYGFLLNFNCGTASYANFGVQIWFQGVSTMKAYRRIFWNGWQQWVEL